jgi:NADH dehydrogenase
MQYMLTETGRRRLLLPLPVPLAKLQAAAFEIACRPLGIAPPLTRDQVLLLGRDNVVAPGMPGLAELGVTPTPVEAVVPSYLFRYRRGGRSVPRFG